MQTKSVCNAKAITPASYHPTNNYSLATSLVTVLDQTSKLQLQKKLYDSVAYSFYNKNVAGRPFPCQGLQVCILVPTRNKFPRDNRLDLPSGLLSLAAKIVRLVPRVLPHLHLSERKTLFADLQNNDLAVIT